ncbi:MAG: aldehyde ferredoxin oxidoreductase family protein [Anaerolineae bacterium]|nr:aldehyde ferredoxin oxidoreductase family protein [Anaerolineae bacterium]
MKTATVDLSTSGVEIVETAPEALRQFVGGRGLGAKLLFELVGPGVEPLSPENYLIFTAGPLAGTPWPTSARLHVTFKSPLTGVYGYANSGGFFAAELRHAGYDAVLITGRAPQPSVLRIEDGEIRIEAAPGLWGQTTEAVHQALLGPEARDGRLACIGPAGENLVRIAAIINDHNRAAARGGPGAVMGSKHLKAIHVRASARPGIPPALRAAAKTATARLNGDPRLDGLRRFGTLVLMEPKNLSGDQPAKNHQLAQVPFIGQVDAAALDRYLVEHKGCYACPIRCARKSRVSEGPYAAEIGGPEYETTNALGPMCWIDDPEAIIYANHLCNLYGLDTISTGVAVAFAMELHEKGLLDDPELSLAWGDVDTLLGLIERIARRQGTGALLAEGVRRAAQQIDSARGHAGAGRYALHVKGMELPRQEPRVAKGFGLGHGTSNRGADHLYALPAIDLGGAWDIAQQIFPAEIVPELMETDNERYKADMVVYGEHFCAVTDALGICKFSTTEEYSLLPGDVAPGLAAVWGEAVTGDDLLEAGERIVNLERLYNVREGLSRADDRLPARFLEEAVPLFGFERDPETGSLRQSPEPMGHAEIYDFEAMLDRYYQLRGWSPDGIPTPATLRRLGLADYLDQDE